MSEALPLRMAYRAGLGASRQLVIVLRKKHWQSGDQASRAALSRDIGGAHYGSGKGTWLRVAVIGRIGGGSTTTEYLKVLPNCGDSQPGSHCSFPYSHGTVSQCFPKCGAHLLGYGHVLKHPN